MAKLTPFGREIRILRMNKDINLSQMAEKIGSTPSYVSGIEVGRRPIPKGYIDKVTNALNASPEENLKLHQAANQSPTVININEIKSNEGRALVGALARKADDLTPEQQEEINKILSSLSYMQGQEPFRKNKGQLVAARSYQSIWNISKKFYEFMPKLHNGQLNIQYALENMHMIYPDWECDIVEIRLMPREEGRTDFTNKRVMIREDVWNSLNNGEERARFTACHEWGHFVLHSNQNIGMSRTEDYPIYQDSEWQADVFAGSLLMPAFKVQEQLLTYNDRASIFNELDNDLINIFGISYSAIQTILRHYNNKGLLTFQNERLFH
ncbi:M78 family (ImmA) (PDB:3DTE) [Commensalibacter communis]|uniref:helix-turn-helix domain-containing protein n=1 Tax=Commensalibacter communis TaxID=2972786 RepID=UPI0022FF5012|nr:XRE family transcriptional regulator [Commensalibacter communis]CAI3951146.1 M78 family (ImmA) (PDB:3DTE) [Commensalibacter communis]